MALPFSEWSREEKDKFAQKRMEMMKLKNEALAKRYAEVEQDRMRAEAKDSAVTSLKIARKEKIVIEKEYEEDIPKVVTEREWDKGKIDQDAEDWSPPKFHGYRSRSQRQNFPDRRAPRKDENWRIRSANVSKDRQSYSKFRSSGHNPKYQESSSYGNGGFRNENTSFSRQRSRANRTSSGTYRSFQNSRFDEPRKKSNSGAAGSASPSQSDSELEPAKHQAKPEMGRMWQDGGITENQHKQSRVENWVKEVNTSGSWNEDYEDFASVGDRYVKKAEAGSRDSAKSYGYANEEFPTKAHSSRDPVHLKNRERYDGFKHGQSSWGNQRARGTHTGERMVGGFENKNQRDFKKKNYGEKNRYRRESDLSDRTSSMKESDYYDCSKDKFNKTTSDSKSSDPDGIWEGVPKKGSFDKPKREFKSSDPDGIWEDYDSKKESFNEPKKDFKSSDPDGIWEDYDPKKESVDEPKKDLKSSDPDGSWGDYEPTKESFVEPKKDLKSSDPDGMWKDNDSKKEFFDKPKNSKSYDPDGIWADYDSKKGTYDKPKYDSKSSDPEGIWEDVECELKYDSEKRSFDKQSSKVIYGREKYNKPKYIQSSNASNCSDKLKRGNFEDDYSRNTNQKFPSSFVKDHSKTKNLKNTEYRGFDDQHLDNRPGARKDDSSFSRVKSNKYKTESKFGGHSGKFENVHTADTYARTSRKYYESKPSPKRTPSYPIKSVDTSSSTSKTIEFNSPDDDVWGEYEDTGIAWNLDGNDTQAECKSNVSEEDLDSNKVSHLLNSSNLVKTDCDDSSEKLCHQISKLKIDEVNRNAVSEEFHGGSYLEEQNTEVCEKRDLVSLEGSIERIDSDKNVPVVTEDQKLKPNEPVDGEKTELVADINDNDKYSEDQNELKVQPPTSDVINATIDSCKIENLTEIISNEIMPSFSEVAESEVQNYQSVFVQSAEPEQTSGRSPNNNLEQANVEATLEKSNVKDASLSNNANFETSIGSTVENNNPETRPDDSKALSSQRAKDDSKRAIKSSAIVTSELLSPKHEGNFENSSGALNLSDDGGWSTVSEDENIDS